MEEFLGRELPTKELSTHIRAYLNKIKKLKLINLVSGNDYTENRTTLKFSPKIGENQDFNVKLLKSNHGFTSLFATLGGKCNALSQCMLI